MPSACDAIFRNVLRILAVNVLEGGFDGPDCGVGIARIARVHQQIIDSPGKHIVEHRVRNDDAAGSERVKEISRNRTVHADDLKAASVDRHVVSQCALRGIVNVRRAITEIFYCKIGGHRTHACHAGDLCSTDFSSRLHRERISSRTIRWLLQSSVPLVFPTRTG